MKFIHAADIHLDSPLSGLSAYADAPTDLLRSATREAFSNLVGLAVDEQVAFVVIAGDLYDGEWRDYNTGIFFARQMGRLDAAGIPVFLAYGNHDAQSDLTKRLVLPGNVHSFSARRPETLRLSELEVALHGQSYKHEKTEDNLAVNYPAAVPGWLNIGVLHTALEGHAAHQRYAPCAVEELAAKGYQYWALGHVHEYRIARQNPWVVFPGNLQGRHVRETGPRGAVLVTADGAEIRSVERVLTDVLRWQVLPVDVSAAAHLADVVKLAGTAFDRLLAQEPEARPMAVRIVLTGRTAAHGELFGGEQQLRAEMAALAASRSADRAWIEKLRLETSPALSAAELASRADALTELHRLLADAPGDPGLAASLLDDLQQLAGRAPKELADLVPALEAIRNGAVGPIVESAIPDVLARLVQEG